MKDGHLVVSEIFGPRDLRRFKAFYTESEPDECWMWNGGGWPQGVFWFRGQCVVASRFAFLVAHGYWPAMQALHTCDHGGCVNPKHIYDGSHAENMRDREVRNRHLHAPTTPKLTMDQAREIRARYAAGGVTYKKLSLEYGLSQAQLSHLIRGISYREEVRPS